MQVAVVIKQDTVYHCVMEKTTNSPEAEASLIGLADLGWNRGDTRTFRHELEIPCGVVARQLGVTTGAVRLYERKLRYPKRETALRLGQYLYEKGYNRGRKEVDA